MGGDLNIGRVGLDAGESAELDDLLPAVYDELHALAGAVIQRNRVFDPTRTTSLIQDAYVRLAKRGLRFRDRMHFLRLAARAMRRVLIDRARNANAQKRGGGQPAITVDEAITPSVSTPDLLALEAALTELATFDARKSRIVELRFFGRLSAEETAEAMGLSPATVKREWTLARAWLFRERSPATKKRSACEPNADCFALYSWQRHAPLANRKSDERPALAKDRSPVPRSGGAPGG